MTRKTLRWSTLVLAVLALPLMAPTCSTGSGLHSFTANSIIIPMDACYQQDVATPRPAYCVGTAQGGDDGILKAYGLVYFLIKHGIAVYWVIDPNKTAIANIDMTLVAPAGSEPVQHYNWAGATTSFMGGGTRIDYRGAPFVIDGVDHDRVIALLQNTGNVDPTGDFAQFRTSKSVDLHVAAAAFQAPVSKTLAGLPPTLALLNIAGGSDRQNSLGVLTDYLTAAGLNFTGAGGTAQGPTHGSIYDTLLAADFLPSLADGGNLLEANGYKLLWVPHWEGPNSYLVGNTGTQITGTQFNSILTNIGTFADQGGNVFAECAGIGSIEGSYDWGSTTVDNAFGAGVAESDSLSTGAHLGLRINSPGAPIAAPYTFNFPASPFSQIGDFPLAAVSGAINDFGVRTTGAYVSNAQRMVVQSDTSDLFTVIPNKGGVATAGTVVYLGGHEYTATGGVRLVLNTLFNLSATCVSPNTSCNTGLPGACAAGLLQCDKTGNVSCVQVVQPSAETCNGVDDNCDGLIDNLPSQTCYDGPAASVYPDGGGVGPCRSGSSSCIPLPDGGAGWGPCQGEILPTPEVCNQIDDDCNGTIDLLPDGGPITASCYDGPLGTQGVGICAPGSAICDPATGNFGACTGETLPQPAQCNDGGRDNNCDGTPDACQCADGQTQACYDGPPGTAGQGICHAGTETCVNGLWGPCTGEQLPQPEQCDGTNTDYNCNGIPGDGCVACNNGQTRSCYDGPAGSLLPDGGPLGSCHQGIQICQNNLWGSCTQEVTPGTELCDGQDNDCDGSVDNNAVCPPSEACINGTCVTAHCSGELASCSEGFACTSSGDCVLSTCGDGGACPVGERCDHGSCKDPCASVNCGAGASCSGGACVAGGCFDTPCSSGEVCEAGACVADPCVGVECPDGDFCRDGYCVSSCVFVHCTSGQVCDIDGTCQPAGCSVTCGSGSCLADGGCGPNLCQGVGCASGQTCEVVNGLATCVADPCADVRCPVGVCVAGQCERSAPDAGSSSASGSGTATTTAGTTGVTTSGNGGTSSGTGSSGGTGTHGSAGASSGSGGAAGAGASSSTGGGGAKSGCGCGTTADVSPIWALAGLLIFARRRRAAGSGHLVAMVVAGGLTALALTACSGGAKTNSSTGSSGSAAGTTAGNTAGSGTSSTTGRNGSTNGSASAGLSGTSGSGCPAGQGLCSGACVDLLDSTTHCGGCNTLCAPDEVCDQGFCAPTNQVNPSLTSVTPDHASPGAQLTIDLVGTLFDPSATVHFTGGGAADQLLPTTFVSAQELTAALDLTGLLAGPGQVRVVNPGRVVSNPVSFTIGGSSAPTLVSLTPNSGAPGADVSFDAAGTLFDTTTTLHAVGPGIIDLVLATTYVSTTDVTAVFPLADPDGGGRGLIPGDYQVFAINGGSAPSNQVVFTVLSQTPVLTAVAPNVAAIGAQVALIGTGDDFDPSTVLHFQFTDGGGDVALSTDFVRVDTVQVPAGSPLDLSGLSPGQYQVIAANQSGAKLSQPVPFTINSNSPFLTAVNPASGLEGHTQPISVVGTGFDPSSVVHFIEGSVNVPEVTTFVSSTQLTCTFDLTSAPAGQAEVAVINSGNLASNTMRFTVLSNQAVLSSLSAPGALQGASLSLSLTGSNFESGAVVHFAGQGTSADITPSSVSPTVIQFSGFDLTPYTTGSYAMSVVNPNAVASAALPFTVEPGTPVLSGISPNTANTDTVQTFTLSGSLFAQGGTVHVTATAPDGGLIVDSSYNPQFVNSTSLKLVNLSLANVPAGSYAVTVINPGPQPSGAVQFTVH